MDLTSPLKRLSFKGKGGDLFVVNLVNLFLTIITVGLYYPWAKARTLSWFYENTELDGHPFHFHGTGREMFKGFIKALGLLLLISGTSLYARIVGDVSLYAIGSLIFFVGFILLFPLIVHGSYRYRTSRSSWKGIHMGYHGSLKTLYWLCVRDSILSFITLGVYSFWYSMNLRNYLLNHVRFGSSSIRYRGDGLEYFVIHLKGIFLTAITFGIYWFWYRKELLSYYVDNLRWEFVDGKSIQFKSTATGGALFGLLLTNALLVLFTLGIGFAWAQVRMVRFILMNVEFHGDADLNAIVQTEREHKDATADDLADLMDVGVFF